MENVIDPEDWISEYRKLMIDDNIEEAIPLKDAHFPKCFFRYRSLSDQTLDSLNNNYLWLSDIDKLNDPHEGSIIFDNNACLRHFYDSEKFQENFAKRTGWTLTKDEIQKLTTAERPYAEYLKICKAKDIPIGFSEEQQFEKVKKRWEEMVAERNKDIRICCFSLSNDTSVMWSYYADNQKGICVEYDFLDSDTIRAFIQPVHYTNEILKIGLFEDYDTLKLVGSNLAKSKNWAHEQEWRLTIFKQKDNFPPNIEAPVPKAIYLGICFNQNEDMLKKQLFQYAINHNVPLYQAKKIFGEFAISFEKVEDLESYL